MNQKNDLQGYLLHFAENAYKDINNHVEQALARDNWLEVLKHKNVNLKHSIEKGAKPGFTAFHYFSFMVDFPELIEILKEANGRRIIWSYGNDNADDAIEWTFEETNE